jgi:hypothetical protein
MVTRRELLQAAAPLIADCGLRIADLTGPQPAIRNPQSAIHNGTGRFLRLHWFEPGMEHGNPMPNRRFRVNSPEVVLHPTFGKRSEVKSSGMLQIRAEEDLSLLAGAELYLELWGGHPGTANKRVTINGRSTYAIPEVGTAAGNCTHQYPLLPLQITDLVSGYNALQFACDQGTSFWGHFIVDQACLRAELKPDHPDLKAAGLDGFSASVRATPGTDETLRLELAVPPALARSIADVAFQGYYTGYDENGDGSQRDWHGFTKGREPVGHLGTALETPFAGEWDLSMLPEQKDMQVRAMVRFRERPDLVYLTAPTGGLSVLERRGVRVTSHAPTDLPRPFWSRAGLKRECTIDLDLEPGLIERAELYVVVWDGGTGTVKEYFTLNGHPLSVVGAGRHDTLYSRTLIPPQWLRRGANRIELLSDTEHHGIEVLLPGPELVVRSRITG